MEIIIGNRFKLGQKLGEGGFAEVYLCTDIKKKNEEVAIKLEQRVSKTPMLEYESKILEYLKGTPGVPNLRSSGLEGDFNYLAMD